MSFIVLLQFIPIILRYVLIGIGIYLGVLCIKYLKMKMKEGNRSKSLGTSASVILNTDQAAFVMNKENTLLVNISHITSFFIKDQTVFAETFAGDFYPIAEFKEEAAAKEYLKALYEKYDSRNETAGERKSHHCAGDEREGFGHV